MDMSAFRKIFPFVATAVAAAALATSCVKQQMEAEYASQETRIDQYIRSKGQNAEVIKNGGSYRIVLEKGEDNGPVAEKGDSIYFHYAGYLFTGSKGELFATNREELASAFPVTDPDFSVMKVRLGHDGLIEGLEKGLSGVKKGEHCEIVFSAKYGYQNKPMNMIPKMSPLLYEIWVTDVIKN